MLQLNLDLAYLNGVRQDGVDFIPFRNASNKDDAPLVLLYRCVSQFPSRSLVISPPILLVSAPLASFVSLSARGSLLMSTLFGGLYAGLRPLFRNFICAHIDLWSCPYRPGHYDILVKQ